MTPPYPPKCFGIGVILLLTLSAPDRAWATQVHGAPEGLYVHLFAHVLFFGAMVYLALRLVASGEYRRPGWGWILAAAVLLALWNVDTIFVHFHQEAEGGLRTLGGMEGLPAFLEVRGGMDRLFYAARLDHLLVVPAFAALYAGIRRLVRLEEEGM